MFKKHQLQQKYQIIHKKYQSSIAFRYLTIATIFLMIIQLIIIGVQSKRFYEHEVTRLTQKVETEANFLSTVSRNAFIRSDKNTLKDLANLVSKDKDVIYSIFLDYEEQVIAHNIQQKLLIDREIVETENSSESIQDIVNKIKKDRTITEISKPVIIGDHYMGELRLGYSVFNLQRELKIISFSNFIYATVVSILFATLTLFIFNRQILSPLNQIKQLAKEFATGNLEQRINLNRQDEIAELGDALNSMAAQFQHTLDNLSKVMDEALIAEKAKSKFLGKMSHELKTPLNGIIGFTQIMQQDSTITSEQLESLDVIEQSGQHLLNLINDVLEITKIEEGKSSLNLSKFDLLHLLNSLEQMFAFKAREKNLDLIFEIDSSVPKYIENDEEKLRQVMVNLLDNSIKFTNSGKVTLTVRNKKDKIHGSHNSLYFKIADTGVGISSEEIDNLFLAFAQTENSDFSHGMGLGLPMSRHLIQLMGGDIAIKSEPNKGTVMRFSIPITEVDVTDLNLPQTYEIESDSMESQFFCNSSLSYDVTKEKLAFMPVEWLQELQDSTIKVDNESIFAVLERVPNQDLDLKQALMDLIENFRYDSILELTDSALSKKK